MSYQTLLTSTAGDWKVTIIIYYKYYFMNRGKSSCQIATNHKVLVAKVRASVRNVPTTGAILSPAL